MFSDLVRVNTLGNRRAIKPNRPSQRGAVLHGTTTLGLWGRRRDTIECCCVTLFLFFLVPYRIKIVKLA